MVLSTLTETYLWHTGVTERQSSDSHPAPLNVHPGHNAYYELDDLAKVGLLDTTRNIDHKHYIDVVVAV